MAFGRKTNTPSDVFRYIDTHNNDPDVCWEFVGYNSSTAGRGYISIGGKRYIAARVVWEIFNGPIPVGMVVRHKCDNSVCCNPTHLELGTQAQNEQDKYERDTHGIPLAIIAEMFRCRDAGMSLRAISKWLKDKHDVTIGHSSIRDHLELRTIKARKIHKEYERDKYYREQLKRTRTADEE